MSGLDYVAVFPGPVPVFEDPWSAEGVCGECAEAFAGHACPCCGQHADAGTDVVHGFVTDSDRWIPVPAQEQTPWSR